MCSWILYYYQTIELGYNLAQYTITPLVEIYFPLVPIYYRYNNIQIT